MKFSPRQTALFATVLPLGTAAFTLSLIGVEAALSERLLGWLTLLTITIIVGLFPVHIPGTRSVISITDAFIFTSVLLYGVHPSVILAGVDALISTRRITRKPTSTLYSFAVMSVSVWVSANVFERLVGRAHVAEKVPLDHLLIPLAAMALSHYLIDSGLVATITAFKNAQPIFRTWRENFLWSSVSFFSGASAAAVIYIFVNAYGLAAFVMVCPILLITYYTYKIYLEKVEQKNRHIREMSDVYLSTIEALTMAIDAKDQITYGHVRRVRVYALGLGRLAGLPPAESEGIKAAALLHDIGKLAIPEYILNKPGKLSPGEFEKMKSHPVIGSEILSSVKFPYPVIPMVRHHHEWWDGSGYPDGLKGEAIPLGARVLAIADCYDAMRSSRPYHRAMGRDEARDYLMEGRGTHFEPRLVDLFLAQVDSFANEAEAVPNQDPTQARETPGTARDELPAVAARSVLDSISSAHREALALYEMARVVGRSLSLNDTMHNILEKLGEFLPYTTAVLYIRDERSDFASARATGGLHRDFVKDRVMPLGEGATGWAIKHNRALYNFDPAMDLASLGGEGAPEYKCAATFPMAVSDRVLGAITFYSEVANQYTIDHERVMEIVAHQASMALLNAVVYERTRASALSDALTELPNSRYLEQNFRRRVAQGEDARLAVLLLDLDGFKGINDRFGHAAGDRILKESAEVLRRSLRADDVLVRLGGDEFVVLTSERPDEASVRGFKQRLQSSFCEHPFSTRQGEPVKLGLSAGFALYPEDGATLESILATADRRMYEDKAQRQRSNLRMVDGGLSRRASGEVPRIG